MLYACDGAWWREHDGAPDFEGIKVTQDASARNRFGIFYVPSVDRKGLSLDPRRIHQGKNSGFQAINTAVLLGAKRILLLGMDYTGKHWHADHPKGLNNPSEGNFKQWRAELETAKPELAKAGVDVINCSPISTINCFRRMTIEDALNARRSGARAVS